MLQAHLLVLPEEEALVRLLGVEDGTSHNSTAPCKRTDLRIPRVFFQHPKWFIMPLNHRSLWSIKS